MAGLAYRQACKQAHIVREEDGVELRPFRRLRDALIVLQPEQVGGIDGGVLPG